MPNAILHEDYCLVRKDKEAIILSADADCESVFRGFQELSVLIPPDLELLLYELFAFCQNF